MFQVTDHAPVFIVVFDGAGVHLKWEQIFLHCFAACSSLMRRDAIITIVFEMETNQVQMK